MKHLRFKIIPLLFIIPVFLFGQMEMITIDNPIFKSGSRSAVQFSHGRHMEMEGVSCTDCHHKFENGINVLDPAELNSEDRSIYCGFCHNTPASLKKSYHRLCIGCHESMIKKNQTAGPRLCGECHK